MTSKSSWMPLVTYIINLAHREDRKRHIAAEFDNKPEFEVRFFPAVEHKFGNIGLWLSLREIIQFELIHNQNEFVLICEDDHKFTKNYSVEDLFKSLETAKKLNAEIILGGMSWFHSSVQADHNLFWIDIFNGFQFTILKRSIFKRILDQHIDTNVHSDLTLSRLSDHKFSIFPYISQQKEFGYSDINDKNAKPGYIDRIFNMTESVLSNQNEVNKFYESKAYLLKKDFNESFDEVILPITLFGTEKQLVELEKEISSKPGWEISCCLTSEPQRQQEVWAALLGSINRSLAEGDDFLVIASPNHRFTDSYSHEYLIRGIINADALGAGLLTGCSEFEDQLVHVGHDLFWVNSIANQSFLVIMKRLFAKIIEYRFQADNVVTEVLSNLTSNKLALFPFVSKPQGSDGDFARRYYNSSEMRFDKIKQVKMKFSF